MTRLLLISSLALALLGCRDATPTSSGALPENVKEERPIILKEGQAVTLIPEGDRSLMVGATVINGRLSISEVDPDGRSLSVTWKDSESWQTSVIDSAKDKTITLIDKDGDGVPDLKAIMTEGSLQRYTLGDPEWNKIESQTKREQVGAPNPLPAE